MHHDYTVDVVWTGDRGSGTSGYRDYSRDHELRAGDKPTLYGSSDPSFRGDPARWNPEELLVAALSQCHLLWYLHLSADRGVVVRAYSDAAHGVMEQNESGGGRFTSVRLRPRVTVADPGMVELAAELHAEAHAKCFIANSVAFPVRHEPAISVEVSATAAPSAAEPGGPATPS